MDLLPTLGVNELTGIALLLLEALAIALAVIGYLVLRHRRALAALHAARRQLREGRASRNAHKALVRKAHEELHGYFQRLGAELTDNDVEARVQPGLPAAHMLLRLWKSLLALEARTLALSHAEIWQDRAEALARHLRGWRQALEQLPGRVEAADEPAVPEAPPQPAAAQADARLREDNRRLRARLGELEAYKQHFTELHAHALAERRASRELRIQLNHAVANAQSPQALEQALRDYDQRRGGMEGFLDRRDVEPLAERHAVAQHRSPAVSGRQQAIIDRSDERVQREYRSLQQTIDQQRELIGELKERVAQAEFDREQIRQYYTTRVSKLERANEQTQQSLNALQTENTRQHRQIRRLTRRLKEQQDREVDRQALEATIDRFATQALEMQGRIVELENALADSELATLRGESPETGASSPPFDAPGADAGHHEDAGIEPDEPQRS